MQQVNFQSCMGEFQYRADQVRLAVYLSQTNHIVISTIRALFNAVTESGLHTEGFVDDNEHVTIYLPFIQNAIKSLISVGYFAFCLDNDRIIVFEPDSYIVVPPDSLHSQGNMTEEFNVIFLKQEDCEKFRKNPPKLILLNAPTKGGKLQCPVMSVVDMHDAIIEFTRLALINDAINLRPKAWMSKKDTAHAPGVYHYLDAKDLDSSDAATGHKSKKNRSEASNYIAEQNYLRGQKNDTYNTTRTFADTCISRHVVVDSDNDPSVLVEIMPNMDVTAMGQTHTRKDLVDLIQLFDRRMCNALGIPTLLLGIPAPGMVHVEEESSMALWKQQCKNIVHIINYAFSILVEAFLTPLHAQKYKKTKDKKYLYPVRIFLNMILSKKNVLELQPFLKPKSFAKHMANATGLEVGDFQIQTENKQ